MYVIRIKFFSSGTSTLDKPIVDLGVVWGTDEHFNLNPKVAPKGFVFENKLFTRLPDFTAKEHNVIINQDIEIVTLNYIDSGFQVIDINSTILKEHNGAESYTPVNVEDFDVTEEGAFIAIQTPQTVEYLFGTPMRTGLNMALKLAMDGVQS